MSTLAYGVSTVGWSGVTFLSVASQFAAAVLTFCCGWPMSGQRQEIFSGLARPATRDPGQYGSSVWSAETTLPERSCSRAVTPYTPKLVIPWVPAWNDAVHEAVVPGARLAETKNGFPAGIRSLAAPRDT